MISFTQKCPEKSLLAGVQIFLSDILQSQWNNSIAQIVSNIDTCWSMPTRLESTGMLGRGLGGPNNIDPTTNKYSIYHDKSKE